MTLPAALALLLAPAGAFALQIRFEAGRFNFVEALFVLISKGRAPALAHKPREEHEPHGTDCQKPFHDVHHAPTIPRGNRRRGARFPNGAWRFVRHCCENEAVGIHLPLFLGAAAPTPSSIAESAHGACADNSSALPFARSRFDFGPA